MPTEKSVEQLNVNLQKDGAQDLPAFDELAALAFYVWEQRGSKSDDVDDWMEAKEQLDARYKPLRGTK